MQGEARLELTPQRASVPRECTQDLFVRLLRIDGGASVFAVQSDAVTATRHAASPAEGQWAATGRDQEKRQSTTYGRRAFAPPIRPFRYTECRS
jgi:hypothetical protein